MKIPCLLFLSQNNKRGAHFQQGSNTSMMIFREPNRGSLSGSSKRRWWTIYWVDVSLPSVLSLHFFFPSFIFFPLFGLFLFCNNYFVISRNVLARTSRLRKTYSNIRHLIHFNLTAWIFVIHSPLCTQTKKKSTEIENITLSNTHTK